MKKKYIIIGGAGFIGSHFVDRLLRNSDVEQVTIFDNFSSGKEWHYEHHHSDKRLRVERGEASEVKDIVRAMKTANEGSYDVAIHLASNPDIAKAISDPTIDFYQGTHLTQNVVEAMRLTGIKKILYASGSGVYGELGHVEAAENHSPLIPISTYGASKLSGEVLISSYAYMFGIQGVAFRFGNVVGPRQTHGVGYDFVRRLRRDSRCLDILGDGSQSKSYIHVEDVIDAVLLAGEKAVHPFQVYNVATGDYITVKEIAELAVECAGLKKNAVDFRFSGGDRGWKGDVPIVRLSIERIQSLGWKCKRSTRDALKDSMNAMIAELEQNKG